MKTLNKLMCVIILCCNNYIIAQHEHVKVKTIQLSPQVYMLQGFGGNIGLFISDEMVFMIDSEYDGVNPQLTAAIKKITDRPVQYLINTHFHVDHTEGNTKAFENGTTLIGHDNVRMRLLESVSRGDVKENDRAMVALPKFTFSQNFTIHLKDERITMYHVKAGHTDGDTIIHFEKNNVIHMGDIFFQNMFPFIDLDHGGSINGIIAAVDQVLGLSNNSTKIIPGHNELSDKKGLLEYKRMLVTIRDRIQTKIDQGKTLEEVINNEAITAEFMDVYGDSWYPAESFKSFVYKSLKKE